MVCSSPLEIVFCAVPMLGHLMPLLPFAEELLRRGHSVTIFHHSDAKYRQRIEKCGLSAVTSVTYDDKTEIFNGIQSHYDNNNKGSKKPDVVVYDFFAVDAADAADAMGVPAIGVFPNPRSINPWAATPEQQESIQWTLWNKIVVNSMESLLARILWCVRAKTRWSRNLSMLQEQDIYPSPYMSRPFLGTAAPSLEFSNLPSETPYYQVGPSITTAVDPMSKDLQQWLDQQTKPIVYVAFGTMYKHTVDSIQTLYEDLRNANVAVLWSLPQKDQALLLTKQLPPQFRIESFVPQVAVLQSGTVSAFVTHCGSNSINEALLAGVPMVCCPGGADQPANASRLSKAGLGIIASNKKQGGVRVALETLLENLDTFRDTSKAFAMELAALKGSQRGADIIENIVARQRQQNKKYEDTPLLDEKRQGKQPTSRWPLACWGLAACLPVAAVATAAVAIP